MFINTRTHPRQSFSYIKDRKQSFNCYKVCICLFIYICCQVMILNNHLWWIITSQSRSLTRTSSEKWMRRNRPSGITTDSWTRKKLWCGFCLHTSQTSKLKKSSVWSSFVLQIWQFLKEAINEWTMNVISGWRLWNDRFCLSLFLFPSLIRKQMSLVNLSNIHSELHFISFLW